MSWFKYISRDSSLAASATPTFIYPPLRYSIDIEAPYNIISQNSVIFETLSNDDFYTYLDSTKQKSTDNTQYAVVYQSSSATPEHTLVRSNIKNGRLYFLAAVDHPSSQSIIDKYYLYFGNKYLKYIGSTPNYTSTNYVQATQGKINTLNTSTPLYETEAFNLDLSNLENYMAQVNANEEDSTKEQFSYFNKTTDWAYYKSNILGAKVSGYFTGPFFKLYGYKQSNGGRIKLTIIKSSNTYIDEDTNESVTSPEEIIVQNHYIDLFAASRSESLIYDTETLEDTRYYFVAEIVQQENSSSIGTEVEFTKFKYMKKYEVSISDLQVSENIRFRNTGNTLL
jgi:hypothetical protein